MSPVQQLYLVGQAAFLFATAIGAGSPAGRHLIANLRETTCDMAIEGGTVVMAKINTIPGRHDGVVSLIKSSAATAQRRQPLWQPKINENRPESLQSLKPPSAGRNQGTKIPYNKMATTADAADSLL